MSSAFPALAAAAVLAGCVSIRPAQAQTNAEKAYTQRGETKAQHDARMTWWRAARFGMFIHWGLYSVPAGTWDGKQYPGLGEWLMHDAKIPVAAYAAFAKRFDPEQFDADRWVGIAKAAGMKYIVITAKHHEGFAMYPTKVDGFNIYDATPYKHDPIGAMAAACRKAGIKFGVYYSQDQDWHHPGGGAYGGHWDPAQDGDFDQYLQNVSVPQIRELLTTYHPSVLWFDTPADMTQERAAKIWALLPLDPGLIVNNRLGGGYAGDTETPEQTIPSTGFPGRDWETCMTINDTWGYKSFDTNFKSTDTLLHNLIDIASKGGNYLLNVGPTSEGVIPAPEVERLRQIGAWMKVNGGAIYGTSASPFKKLPFDGRCTVKGDTLFLHVFHWPDAGLTLHGLMTEVRDARALDGGRKLAVTRSADGTLSIARPDKIDPIATVIALRLKGAPVVDNAVVPIAPQADGSYALTATDADIHGSSAQVENHDGKDDIGYWTDRNDTASWTVKVPDAQAGDYRVELDYGDDPGSAGSTYTVGVNGKTVGGTVESTGAWHDYRTVKLDGVLTLTPGTETVIIAPQTMPHGAVMNLRAIRLIPAAAGQ